MQATNNKNFVSGQKLFKFHISWWKRPFSNKRFSLKTPIFFKTLEQSNSPNTNFFDKIYF